MTTPMNVLAMISAGQKLTGVIHGAEKMFRYKVPITSNYYKKSVIYNNDKVGYLKLLSNTATEINRINCFGGDHSISKSTLFSSLYKTRGNMKLVWVDAHADMNTPHSSPSGNMHGMPVAYGLNLYRSSVIPRVIYPLQPNSIYYIGIRDLDEFEKNYIFGNCIKFFTVDHVNSDITSVFEEIDDDKRPTHFSFDVDSIDPEFISSTGTPVANGISLETACNIMYHYTSRDDTFHAEIVEYNPEIGNDIETWESLRILLDHFILDPNEKPYLKLFQENNYKVPKKYINYNNDNDNVCENVNNIIYV